MPKVTETLCTRCGLCCDGTLLGDVELSGPREASRLAVLGLDVEADEVDVELLVLPCAGLRGTRCSVYAYRPQSCRAFDCRLLQDTESGLVSTDEALGRIAAARAQVRHVTQQLTGLESRRGARLPLAERVANALAAMPSRSAVAARRRAALTNAYERLAGTIRTTFLD